MRILLATVALLVALPGFASAADVVINNGLDCSNPGNVIDDNTYQNDWVYVRNVGCGNPNPSDDCPSPGDLTEVCLGDAGYMEYVLEAYDSSRVAISSGYVRLLHALGSSAVTKDGGEVDWLSAYGSSTVTMSGGMVSGGLTAWVSSTVTMDGGVVDWLHALESSTVTISGGVVRLLHAYGSSTVTMDGGTLEGDLYAADSSTIRIAGSDFAVDGSPVPYGELAAQTGTLTGTLISGDPIDAVFHQGSDVWTGTVRLVPAGGEVAIDVIPGDPENRILGKPGVPILLAILGSEDVDVRDVDVTTLAFGPGEASPALDLTHPFIYLMSLHDVNGDEEDDLLAVFLYGETGLPLGESQACLTGEIAGDPFAACDTVLVFPKGCGLGVELLFILPPLMWLRGRQRRKRG